MHILFVTPYPPSRIRVRSYGLVRQLAQHHRVTVVAPAVNERERADADALRNAGIEITLVDDRGIERALRAVRALGSPLPMQVAFGAAPALRQAIARELATGQYDVIHVEHLRALGALPDSSALSVPLVWDAVDCVSHLLAQRSTLATPLALRPIVRLEARRTRAYEWRQIQHLRHIIVTCERDRQSLLRSKELLSGERIPRQLADICVISNGVDQGTNRDPDRDDGFPEPAHHDATTLVFSGKMSYHANVAAIAHLAREILPRVWEHRPAVTLMLAGSNPPYAVRRLARDPRIVVTHYVPDLQPYIARARIAVCPLPYAVGVQNKILEAMSMGTPVVASSVALAGLQAMPGRDLLVADTPAEFTEHVLHLLDDDSLWQDLAAHGLAYVREHHSWQAMGMQLATVYARAVEHWVHTDDPTVFA